MNYKHLIFAACVLSICSCKQEVHLTKIEGERIEINDSLTADETIEQFIKPYREHVNQNLDSVLAYAVDTYDKMDGELNTAIGNFMADMVMEQANPIFVSRTGDSIDMALLNHGGIRAIISKGEITTRTAYEVMPFENSIVVIPLKGQYIKELVDYLVAARRAHPISKLKIGLDADYKLSAFSINNKVVHNDSIYYVLTTDYLYNGGDRMDFFKKSDTLYDLNYKIRNAMIDYFIKIDTLKPITDDRFTKLN